MNRLVLIGNGFDLAHGLKTSYIDFLDWYMCDAFQQFYEKKSYSDCLIEIKNKYSSMTSSFENKPKTFEEVLSFISYNDYQSITYKSPFFKDLLELYNTNNWVDIERYYFGKLKAMFSSSRQTGKKESVLKLNSDFDLLIKKLSEYITIINNDIRNISELNINSKSNFKKVFEEEEEHSNVKFLNFNYTETLQAKHYAHDDEVIHIHGRVTESEYNPIIFGYGDESDPAYQSIEDSGENIYLEHIKSFGYFKTSNYHELLSYIDSAHYVVYVVGHSCGISDRILLNEIFEHRNCNTIEIFYYVRKDGSDNFKEITQEISRHFKPHNKGIMRRKVGRQNADNIIPQKN